jgi:hypothetical protein
MVRAEPAARTPGARERRARALAIGGGAALLLSSCQWLVALKSDTPPQADAAADLEVLAVAYEACGATRPPRPHDTSRAELAPFLLAGYAASYKPTTDPAMCPIAGLDLDDADTQPRGVCDQNRSCVPADEISAKLLCDQPGGIDNTAVNLLGRIDGVFRTEVVDPATLVASGLVNVLLTIEHYNGEREDEDVSISVYTSSGIEGVGPPPGSDFTYKDLVTSDAAWDGSQDASWMIDENSVVLIPPNGIKPKQSGTGYVSGGILVANMDPGEFSIIGVGGQPILYHDGILTGDLVKVDGRWRLLRARLGGVTPSGSVLQTIGATKLTAEQLCAAAPGAPNRQLYEFIRGEVCKLRDIPGEGGASTPCSGLSLGVTFAAIEARFAQTEAGAPVLTPSRLRLDLPCADYDAGTIWCDDCDWSGAGRCAHAAPAPLPDAGASDASGD